MNKATQPPPAEVKKEMSPEEIAAAQKAGRLIYRPIPYQVGEETRIKTSDNATYRLDGKTLRRLDSGVKLSKKERRLIRKNLANQQQKGAAV